MLGIRRGFSEGGMNPVVTTVSSLDRSPRGSLGCFLFKFLSKFWIFRKDHGRGRITCMPNFMGDKNHSGLDNPGDFRRCIT